MILEQDGYPFSFNSDACAACKGHCCTGEPGYIWVSAPEMTAIAAHLQIDPEQFKSEYLEKVGYKYSIRELKRNGGHECLFFDERISGCSIYHVRPSQCRTFPFWDYFLHHPKEAGEECPGIIYHSSY